MVSRRRFLHAGLAAGTALVLPRVAFASSLDSQLASRFATNGGVRLHYMVGGQGPPVLFVHGFPGWWGMWRPLMTALIASRTVIAMDMRAFNLSDKPRSKTDYGVVPLLGDIRAVLAHAGYEQATIVGHDFGGAFAYTLAVGAPDVVAKLVVLNGLHPWSLQRALHDDPRQRKAARYAQELRRPDALRRPIPKQIANVLPRHYPRLNAEALAALLAKPGSAAYREALTAMKRTYIQGALDYYGNFPTEPYADPGPKPKPVQCPTLVVFGRDDPFLLADDLSDLPSLVTGPLTIKRIRGAGHFVLEDAPRPVVSAVTGWLAS